MILKVLPRVRANGSIDLDVEQEISNVANPGATLTPTISQRRVRSTISVMSGQTVLLGGLISEREDSGKSGIPGLRDIKFLGDLFGSTTANKQRTELIIFIRPQLIRDSLDARQVAEEFRDRLHTMRTQRSRRRLPGDHHQILIAPDAADLPDTADDLQPNWALVLAATAAVALLSAATLPWTLALTSTALAALMVAGADLDARTQLLPDTMTLATLACGLGAAVVLDPLSPWQALLDGSIRGAATAGILRGLRFAYWKARGTEGLGLGDVKLAAGSACGCPSSTSRSASRSPPGRRCSTPLSPRGEASSWAAARACPSGLSCARRFGSCSTQAWYPARPVVAAMTDASPTC